MAGLTLGASSPASSSRTRRLHGVFHLGDVHLVVASSRRAGDQRVELGIADSRGIGESMRLLGGGRGTAAQARLVARALLEAADAVDTAERHPQFIRGEVHHGR